MEEVTKGISVEDLRARLTNKNDRYEIKEPAVSKTKSKIPDDLIQVQAYIRWEKAGKPNYSPEQQQVTLLSPFAWLVSVMFSF